ncbi:MAG: transporter [Pseudomonadota bacterium]
MPHRYCKTQASTVGPHHFDGFSVRSFQKALIVAVLALGVSSNFARADETGVSLWLPGFFGSLAAAPQTPGFAYANVFYVPSVGAGGSVVFARQVTRGDLTVNFNGNLNARLDGRADLYLGLPSYTFASPILGGQASVAMIIPFGGSEAGVNATLNGSAGPLGFNVSRGTSGDVLGFGDLAPVFSLRWNAGVSNFMTYALTDIPIGVYNPDNLVNLGIGHSGADVGGGYTYFNPETGNEISGVLGFTYNFENPYTQYRNGVDMHFDWGASRFFTKQLQIGAVGYAYEQLSCDSGAGDRVGCFESRVVSLGAQVGYIIPMGKLQGYVNVKAYKEFAAENRPYGWNAWLTFAISEAAPVPAAQAR